MTDIQVQAGVVMRRPDQLKVGDTVIEVYFPPNAVRGQVSHEIITSMASGSYRYKVRAVLGGVPFEYPAGTPYFFTEQYESVSGPDDFGFFVLTDPNAVIDIANWTNAIFAAEAAGKAAKTAGNW